jgi:NADH:ubiquinone oxidoreductase subunit E
MVLDAISRYLGIGPGETTKDLMFSLERVNCLGACALGPVVVINGEYLGKMTPAKIEKILESLKKE